MRDSAGLDAAEITRRLRDDGYAVIPRLLDDRAVDGIRRCLDAMLDEAAWGKGFDGTRTRRVWALLAKTRALDTAALHPLVLATTDQLIGPGSQFTMTYATEVHPGQSAQPLHYEQGVYPLPRDRDFVLTAIWAFSEFTAGNGATVVVPRSHRRDAGKPDPGDGVPIEMPAGSLLLMAGRTWHGAGANTSTVPRLAVVLDYVQPWLRPCEAHALIADPAEVRGLPPRLQELLGFGQASPYLGLIDGMHPRDWLAAASTGLAG